MRVLLESAEYSARRTVLKINRVHAFSVRIEVRIDNAAAVGTDPFCNFFIPDQQLGYGMGDLL